MTEYVPPLCGDETCKSRACSPDALRGYCLKQEQIAREYVKDMFGRRANKLGIPNPLEHW